MKKVITLVLVMVLVLSSFGLVAEAKVGDVIGTALHTDIVAYINHFAIPSYIVNGTSVIVAEDLRSFGFNVDWDPYNRTLDIYRNWDNTVYPMYVGKGYSTGSKYANILQTDIKVWVEGYEVTSYNMNGYTMIPMEELTMVGDVVWDGNARTLKMWIEDGLEMAESPQLVSKRYYPGTSIPDFGWNTESICLGKEDYQNKWYYYSDGDKVQSYINQLKKAGWYLDKSIQGDDGEWYLGYINKSLRSGVAIAEVDGFVSIQAETNIDYWR